MNFAMPSGLLSGAGLCFSLALWVNGAEPTAVSARTNSPAKISLNLQSAKPAIWKQGVGKGFARSVQHVGLVAGAGAGMTILGSRQAHDLALGGLSYGRMWGDVKGEGHCYRGNWEWRAEIFGGSQFNPDTQYLVGLAPHLRYNFATGSRLVPFVDWGAGVTATDIRGRDLSGGFQFNLQPGVGVNWFLRDNLALSLEYRFLHLSSARLSTPNLGLNTSLFLAGLNWFF